jgi:hypothetical protein
MEIDPKLMELLSKPLLETFGTRIKEITYKGGMVSKYFGNGKYSAKNTRAFGHVNQRVLHKFTLSEDGQEYFYLTPVLDWDKGKTMVPLCEIGTIMDFSIPRGLFIGAFFGYPYVRALRNLDDTADTPTWTPLEKLFQKEQEGRDDSAFVELFLKLPNKTSCAYGGTFGHLNKFSRSQFTMESMPKRRDSHDYMDSDPSIFIIPRNGKTVFTVRFQSFAGKYIKSQEAYTQADVYIDDRTGKKIEIALPEVDQIRNAYSMLLGTIEKTKPFAIDGTHTSQYTGGLASYLSFEIARALFRPEEEISFEDFLDYNPRVVEIADAMNANKPGVEVFPLLWYPLLNLNPAGSDEIKYTYSKYDYQFYWKTFEMLVDKIKSEGIGIYSGDLLK